MKKLLLLVIFTLVCCSISAQDCDLCGTWSGVFKVFNDGDNTTQRLYIKIKRYGGKYVVQVKEVYDYEGQSSKTYYWHECTDVKVNGNLITWTSFSHQYEDGHLKQNGRVIDIAKIYYVCSARLDDEILYFTQKVEGYYYARNGELIGEHHQPAFPTKELYKNDDNW